MVQENLRHSDLPKQYHSQLAAAQVPRCEGYQYHTEPDAEGVGPEQQPERGRGGEDRSASHERHAEPAYRGGEVAWGVSRTSERGVDGSVKATQCASEGCEGLMNVPKSAARFIGTCGHDSAAERQAVR
jgi:hypothetical protein